MNTNTKQVQILAILLPLGRPKQCYHKCKAMHSFVACGKWVIFISLWYPVGTISTAIASVVSIESNIVSNVCGNTMKFSNFVPWALAATSINTVASSPTPEDTGIAEGSRLFDALLQLATNNTIEQLKEHESGSVEKRNGLPFCHLGNISIRKEL